MRREALLAEHTQDLVVRSAGKVSVEDDQGFVGHIFQPQGSAFRQTMRLRKYDDKLLFEEQLALQIHLIDGRPQKTNVDLAFVKSFILEGRENVPALDI